MSTPWIEHDRSLSRHSKYINTVRSARSALYSVRKSSVDFETCIDQYFPPQPPKEFKDNLDFSVDPSYTDFRVPYHIICEARYAKAKVLMERQFQAEIRKLLDSMESAYEAARFMRHMSIMTFWPPLHSRLEIEHFQKNFFRLNRKRERRLNELMNSKII